MLHRNISVFVRYSRVAEKSGRVVHPMRSVWRIWNAK
jgi:hypothetical protein